MHSIQIEGHSFKNQISDLKKITFCQFKNLKVQMKILNIITKVLNNILQPTYITHQLTLSFISNNKKKTLIFEKNFRNRGK